MLRCVSHEESTLGIKSRLMPNGQKHYLQIDI